MGSGGWTRPTLLLITECLLMLMRECELLLIRERELRQIWERRPLLQGDRLALLEDFDRTSHGVVEVPAADGLVHAVFA